MVRCTILTFPLFRPLDFCIITHGFVSDVCSYSPDSNGWGPIYHCAAVPRPSIQILDALYCAGADVSLFTIKQTPLHIVSRSAHFYGTSDSLYSVSRFILHLIHDQDLGAALSARDKDDETCIHIAAEHGNSLHLLMLLECDVNGTVRKMRNSRGWCTVTILSPASL